MIKICAARRAGEMLKDMAKKGERDRGRGGDRKSQGTKAPVKTLNDLGITSDESKRWQKMASVPDDAPGFLAASLLSDRFCQRPNGTTYTRQSR